MSFPKFIYTMGDREKNDFTVPAGHIPQMRVDVLQQLLDGDDVFLLGDLRAESVANIARTMIHDSLAIKPGEIVVVGADPDALYVAVEVMRQLIAFGCTPRLMLTDFVAESQITEEQVMQALYEEYIALFDGATKYLGVRYGTDPALGFSIHSSCQAVYDAAQIQLRDLIMGHPEKLLRCNTALPAKWQARADGYSEEEYVRLFEQALAQPWRQIEVAQAQFINDVLNPGKEVVIIIDPVRMDDPTTATHLTMSIDGMTFANSVIKRNFPGSEMFSAPVLDSVQGQVYFDGNFNYEHKRMQHIRLRFENGRVVEASAEEGDDALQEIIDKPGARFVGELGIGTNPGLLDALFSNGLLVEKVGGTFHLALGWSYKIKEYDGVTVVVDNGNDSSVHWDITCVNNLGNNSRMYVDGNLVRFNGRFIGEQFHAINPNGEVLRLEDVPDTYHLYFLK